MIRYTVFRFPSRDFAAVVGDTTRFTVFLQLQDLIGGFPYGAGPLIVEHAGVYRFSADDDLRFEDAFALRYRFPLGSALADKGGGASPRIVLNPADALHGQQGNGNTAFAIHHSRTVKKPVLLLEPIGKGTGRENRV